MTSSEAAENRDGDEGKSPVPTISLPKGGGAVRGIGEKFSANPVSGTGSLSVPIALSPGKAGFGPDLHLTYDSGAGSGSFGFGWSLSLPAITRYACCHAYLKGEEREFRGFGMLEQWDTEDIGLLAPGGETEVSYRDSAFQMPPVHTKTWFHTGAWLEQGPISRQFESEYYRERGLTSEEFRALLLPIRTSPTGSRWKSARPTVRSWARCYARRSTSTMPFLIQQVGAGTRPHNIKSCRAGLHHPPAASPSRLPPCGLFHPPMRSHHLGCLR